MIDLLKTAWGLVAGLATAAWDVIWTVLVFCFEILTWLHVSHPRLEGLLIGVALAWLMLRRDKHPALRVLSSPLKLIVDILDLAWDQVVEVATDVLETAKSWTIRPVTWVWSKISGSARWCMDKLRSLRDALTPKEK